MMQLVTKPHVVQASFKGRCVYRKFITPRIGDESYHEEHFAMIQEALNILHELENGATQ